MFADLQKRRRVAERPGSSWLPPRVTAATQQLQEGAARRPRCAQANWGRGLGFLFICFETSTFVIFFFYLKISETFFK